MSMGLTFFLLFIPSVKEEEPQVVDEGSENVSIVRKKKIIKKVTKKGTQLSAVKYLPPPFKSLIYRKCSTECSLIFSLNSERSYIV